MDKGDDEDVAAVLDVDLHQLTLGVLIGRDGMVRIVPGLGEDGPVVTQQQAAQLIARVASQLERQTADGGRLPDDEDDAREALKGRAADMEQVMHTQAMDVVRTLITEALAGDDVPEDMPTDPDDLPNLGWVMAELGARAGAQVAVRHMVASMGGGPDLADLLPDDDEGQAGG